MNFYDHYLWTAGNTRGVLQSRHQQQFSINVWAVTAVDSLDGKQVLLRWPTGGQHRNFWCQPSAYPMSNGGLMPGGKAAVA
jgi:hypothetical protein